MPLRKAVFAFGIAEDTETVNIGATTLSELAKMLENKSGACQAEIDPAGLVFSFHFVDRGATVISGPPWGILEQLRELALNPDPGLDGEALFDKEGFVSISISDEEATRASKQYRAVQDATGLVWRQYMLRSFDRAVSAGAVVLYARTQTVAADFERLPADVWALLEIADWQNEWQSLPMAQRIGRFMFNVPPSTCHRRMRRPLPMRQPRPS
jgi:hypothetical protein